jgi:hypothetical protein
MQEKMNGGGAENMPRNASHTPARWGHPPCSSWNYYTRGTTQEVSDLTPKLLNQSERRSIYEALLSQEVVGKGGRCNKIGCCVGIVANAYDRMPRSEFPWRLRWSSAEQLASGVGMVPSILDDICICKRVMMIHFNHFCMNPRYLRLLLSSCIGSKKRCKSQEP